jgi:hypothetical protein
VGVTSSRVSILRGDRDEVIHRGVGGKRRRTDAFTLTSPSQIDMAKTHRNRFISGVANIVGNVSGLAEIDWGMATSAMTDVEVRRQLQQINQIQKALRVFSTEIKETQANGLNG